MISRRQVLGVPHEFEKRYKLLPIIEDNHAHDFKSITLILMSDLGNYVVIRVLRNINIFLILDITTWNRNSTNLNKSVVS